MLPASCAFATLLSSASPSVVSSYKTWLFTAMADPGYWRSYYCPRRLCNSRSAGWWRSVHRLRLRLPPLSRTFSGTLCAVTTGADETDEIFDFLMDGWTDGCMRCSPRLTLIKGVRIQLARSLSLAVRVSGYLGVRARQAPRLSTYVPYHIASHCQTPFIVLYIPSLVYFSPMSVGHSVVHILIDTHFCVLSTTPPLLVPNRCCQPSRNSTFLLRLTSCCSMFLPLN